VAKTKKKHYEANKRSQKDLFFLSSSNKKSIFNEIRWENTTHSKRKDNRAKKINFVFAKVSVIQSKIA
jgi:hypothetical protein